MRAANEAVGPGPADEPKQATTSGGRRGEAANAAAQMHRFFAVTSHGLEPLLADELRELGLRGIAERKGGVAFRGTLRDGYRTCLWSRTAVRVLLELHRFAATTPGQVYDGVRTVDWSRHIGPEGTLACNAVGTTPVLRNTLYTAQVVKDAVVDDLRDRTGARPTVDPAHPDVQLHLVLNSGRGLLSLDLSGEPLHRRGYRREGVQGEAPLKETLAAGILRSAGWPDLLRQGAAALHDPLCGSGTLIIEGALAAADVAPGLLRPRWGFSGWQGHDARVWSELVAEARRRRDAGLRRAHREAERASHGGVLYWGGDRSAEAIILARDAAARAGVQDIVRFERADVASPVRTRPGAMGLVVTNPPYGVRMKEGAPGDLYHVLAGVLAARYAGWRAAVLIADPGLAAIFSPDADAGVEVMNGAPVPHRQVHSGTGLARADRTRAPARRCRPPSPKRGRR